MREFTYFAATDLREALRILSEDKENTVILNGGTDVVVQLRDQLIAPKRVLDIKRLGLNAITFSETDGLMIGACATLNELGGNKSVQTYYPFLAEAALSVGSKQVRNRATCAGNIINASPLADTSTPLLVCDAVVLCEGPAGAREIPLSEFFVFVRRTKLQKDEIVTGIRVPYGKGLTGVFSKISRRREVDLSTVCGTVAQVNGQYRAAFGAVAPVPLRLPKTEAYLNSVGFDTEQAVAIAQSEVSPIDDVRAGKEYRLDMVGVILKRGLAGLGEGATA